MNTISIISNSLIVNELLKLIFQKRQEEYNFLDTQEAGGLYDDTIIIDDSIDNLDATITLLKEQNNTIILLGENETNVDFKVAKPFMPKAIEEILDKIKAQPKKEESKEIKTNVLDPNEIAHIKELMTMELEEDEEESMLTPLESLKERISFKAKGKSAKTLLYNLTKMDAKELKALLKKSKVSIKIDFKDRDDA